jgi:transketolase
MRIEYGKYLTNIGAENDSIIALEADLKDSTQSIQFSQTYPERFYDIGIAEQNMVGIAAGLATKGKLPIVHSFACFISMRACEQVRTTIAYPNLNVKFIVSHGGISCGSAGSTHHSIEDIAIMRAIPNIVVIIPCDSLEIKQALEAAIHFDGPVYIRMTADSVEDVCGESAPFQIGKATKLKNGMDATIITTGTMAQKGLRAAQTLKTENNIEARVLHMASIKPIDRDAIELAARETKYIVTAEEHNIIGGLGSAVSEIVAEKGGASVQRIGIVDRFSDTGSSEFLMRTEGLTSENIKKKVLDMIGK